ncbi:MULTISPECIES: GNAT family N-acetyltransferase [Saccharibacillus]|uniref:GNAT family N-acetyltransferase n=1 Tax=Saccharibacillus TaxID=456492 RepID=UPI001238AAA7|nr:GNAT family N-acetyltransferase [Saccharibacillus sp. WB 17]MWJ32605.1 GNAT family N-acetyltransferase [Saccharibacillus sp. WB 17]
MNGMKLTPAHASDVERLAELRAEALHESLTRLGRYDERGVRERFRRSFVPEHTKIVEQGGEFAGCVALRPEPEGYWLEHFYLRGGSRGSGLGTRVLHAVLGEERDRRLPVRLNVLQGSAARRLYERFGFETESEDEIDVYLILHPRAEVSEA